MPEHSEGAARLPSQFLRFAAVGVVGTGAHYSTLAFLVLALSVDAVFASAIGYVVGAVVNYALNRHWTFNSKVAHRIGFPRFMAVAGLGFLLNTLIMAITVWGFGLHAGLSQLLATAAVLSFNYFANRAWTFRDAQY